ncbi:MAG: hypothetical protein P8182_16270 [Deltaproteobacteria bacterium]
MHWERLVALLLDGDVLDACPLGLSLNTETGRLETQIDEFLGEYSGAGTALPRILRLEQEGIATPNPEIFPFMGPHRGWVL